MNIALSIYPFLRLLNFMVSLLLGLFVLFKNKKSQVNRSFFILTLSVTVWQAAYFILFYITDVSFALFWIKLAYCGVVFITSATYHFMVSFLNLQKKRVVRIFYIFSFLAIFLVQSRFLITSIKKFSWGYYPLVGAVHNIFLILWCVPFILSLKHLYVKYRQTESPFNKKRIQYFLITLPIAYLGMIDYLPSYNIDIYPFGLIPVTFFVLSTTFAIIRYRILNIQIIIKKLSLISLAFVISMGLIYIGSFYVQPYFYNFLGKNPIIFPLIISSGVSLIFLWFINFVRRIEESELSKKFAYRSLLKKEIERLSVVKNEEELFTYLSRDLSNLVRLDYIGILFLDENNKEFVLVRSLTRTKKRIRIPLRSTLAPDSPLIIELLRKKRPLVYSELEYYAHSQDSTFEKKEFLIKVITEMQRLGAEITIPCFCEERLLAVINLGNKLNPHEIITNEDIELFHSLSNQIARALYGFMLKREKIQLIVASQNILIGAIEAKDQYTRGHTDRVANYATLIGKKLERQLRTFLNGLHNLIWAALLHDIGKICIPDSILFKQGILSEEELTVIREHPINGIKIIRPLEEWLGVDIYECILHHHENYDGSGYPDHQKGENIHFFARIIRVADAFDAMTTERPYKSALIKEEAIENLRQYKNIHFDPFVIGAMEELYLQREI